MGHSSSTCFSSPPVIGRLPWRIGMAYGAVMAGVLALAPAATAQSGQPAGPSGWPATSSPTAEDHDPQAAGHIYGVVLDSATHEPIEGVWVRVIEGERQDLTHDGGRFHLRNLSAGGYTLIASALGYRSRTQQVVVVDDEVTHVRIWLVPSAIRIGGIVVTGTLGGRAEEDAFRPVGVVSGDELARQMRGTVAATLEEEAGVASVSMGPATARPVIRGLGGDRILMLEDGERVGDVSSSSPDHAVAMEPLSALRIEVLRGPAALMYGSNALGGVVNVIREDVPQQVPDRITGTLTLHGQSVNNSAAGEVSAVGGRGPLALRLAGSARRSGDIETPAGTLENTDGETYSLSLGAGLIGSESHLGASARFYRNHYGIPGGFLGGHPGGVRVEMWRQAARAEAEIHRDVGPFSSLEASGAYTRYKHTEIEASGLVGTEFGLLMGTGELLARHGRVGPLTEGVGGVRVEWRDLAFGGALLTPPTEAISAAGYLVERADLRPIMLEFGARYDWRRISPDREREVAGFGTIRTRTYGAVSGSLAALAPVASWLSFGASVSRAFRTPDGNELFSRGPHLAAFSEDVGNPDLRAEFGLGLDAFARMSSARVSGEVAVFRNRIDDFIYLRNTGRVSPRFGGLTVYQTTNGDALLTGWESSLQWTPLPRVAVDANASGVRGTLATSGEPLPLIPPARGRVGLRYERLGWYVGAAWRWAAAQDRPGEFEEPTAGYGIADASAGYRWTAFGRSHSLTLRAENLTDATFTNHLSRVRAIMPEPGRSINVFYRMLF